MQYSSRIFYLLITVTVAITVFTGYIGNIDKLIVLIQRHHADTLSITAYRSNLADRYSVYDAFLGNQEQLIIINNLFNRYNLTVTGGGFDIDKRRSEGVYELKLAFRET